jgi:hypothetical protein
MCSLLVTAQLASACAGETDTISTMNTSSDASNSDVERPSTWQDGEALRELLGTGDLVEFAGVTLLVLPESGAGAAVRAMRNEDIALVDAKYARVLDPNYAAEHEYPADTRTYANDAALLEELGL